MIDLLTQTPFYDRYLAEAVAPLVDRFTLYAIRFHHEPDYFDGVAFDRSPGLIDWMSGLRIKVCPLRRAGKLVEYFLNWFYLLDRFRRQPPDVVHVQWLPLLSQTQLELRMVEHVRQLGIPVVYTVHNYLPHDASPALRSVYRRAYSSVDHLIVHARTDRERLVTGFNLPQEKITIIPHGPLFFEQFGISREHARAALELALEDMVLLMFGVIRPYKGVEETVQALAEVVKKRPDCKLIVAGNALDSGYLQRVQALADALGVQSHIQWHVGYIPSVQVGLFHAAADVVLFPYHEISQSGAFLTAAALGKCTLTTLVGGLAEIVRDGENGVQVDSSDPRTLVAGLQRCITLSAAERERMGQALKQYVGRNLDWKSIAKSNVDVYHRLLEGRAWKTL